MVDIFAKRISPPKRHILYLFQIIQKYLRIKENPSAYSHEHKTLHIISGRAPHSSLEGKKIIEAIYKVMKLVNEDLVTKIFMRVIFIPNFNVALCE
jgi:starch phosphorylase